MIFILIAKVIMLNNLKEGFIVLSKDKAKLFCK